MKKILFSIVLGVSSIFAFVNTAFAAPPQYEHIPLFSATFHIQPDASVQVQERIEYNFGDQERHGIYRTIPVLYPVDGGKRRIILKDISVTDEKNIPYTFETSAEGNDEKIKIGDANITVTGQKTYIISYTVDGVLNYFSEHDEFYWNVTGNHWTVPILQSSAIVTVPQAKTTSSLAVACYSGTVGSKSPCTSFLNSTTSSMVAFDQTTLIPGEGFTIVVGFPKNVVAAANPIIEPGLQNGSPWWYLVTLAIFVYIVRKWWREGRDPKGRGVIIAEYEAPDNLTPAEVGYIYDNNLDNKDISAEIVELAVKGHLTITREPGGLLSSDDYTFTKKERSTDNLSDHQQTLLKNIFSYADKNQTVKLSKLKYKFNDDLSVIRHNIKTRLTTAGYFDKFGYWPALKTGLSGIGVLIGGFVLGGLFNAFHLMAAGIFSFLILIIFAFAMQRRNLKSVLTKEKILGFKLFLEVTEKDRIKFHNAPEKDPALFEKMLPYAMVLGVEGAWAKQFAGIYTTNPSWYSDPSMNNAFNILAFSHVMNSFQKSSGSTMGATASSGGSGLGGGGFSGGGFGGGGGGSW